MVVYLGADHGGFAHKEEVKRYLIAQGYAVEDCGALQLIPSDDYPVYAAALVRKYVSQGLQGLGILFCRSGAGVSIAANKFQGIRAAISFSADHAASCRNDDDVNILCIPSDYITVENTKPIIKAFLATPFGNTERGSRRIDQLYKIEQGSF